MIQKSIDSLLFDKEMVPSRVGPVDNRNLHAGRAGNTKDETHGIIEAAEKMPLLMGKKLGIEIV